jgi:hypothetical protein
LSGEGAACYGLFGYEKGDSMPRPEKTIEIDRVLESIIKHDSKTRARGRRVLPEELVEAMDYYVRWNLARNRGRALIELAMPMALEVVQKVREIGIQEVKERAQVIGRKLDGGSAEAGPKPKRRAPRRTRDEKTQ